MATGITYSPAGAPTQTLYGNGLAETRTYNNRLQPTQIRTYNTSTNLDTLNMSYGFVDANGHNNGNLATWNATGQQIFMRSYGYDQLNRISSMSSPADPSGCLGLSWTFDVWGNRVGQTPTGGTCNGWSSGYNAANQIINSNFLYDAAGNLTFDGTHHYTYDAENRLTQVDYGTTATYRYDGTGRRAEKVTSIATADYLYDLDGNVVANVAPVTGGVSDIWNQANIYLNGQFLAQYANGTVNFVHRDHLGSTRLVTALNGSQLECDDYLPYGELLSYSGNTPCINTASTPKKFTGKERDSESGLDNFGARYNSSQYGRFMTPDSLMVNELRLINPQRWNLYSYSINNPITYTDPDGHDAIAVNFAGGVPVGGHQGIIVVHADGQATYARFGPAHADRPFDQGKITVTQLAPVKFGTNNLPTDASYKELADEAGKAEGQPASTVGFNYFKTSETESIMLSNWINQFNDKNTPDYAVTGTNCAAFCIAGLLKANAIENKNISLIPDRLFMLLASRANQNYTWKGTTPQKGIVTHCIRHNDGSCQ